MLQAEDAYHRTFNACGGRVKYGWGGRVDRETDEAKKEVLKLLGKSSHDYDVAFTLNTTYGINLVLHQLADGIVRRIVTSDIEHNSVFLPAMSAARKRGIPRTVVARAEDGSLPLGGTDLSGALVIVNTMSNIDGRKLVNVAEIEKAVRKSGGLLFLDGAQHLGHDPSDLRDIGFDALFASAHKMYGQSLGVIVIRRTLLEKIDPWFIGGGTVDAVHGDEATLKTGTERIAVLEPGLQHWAGIIGLRAAIRWMEHVRFGSQKAHEYEASLARSLQSGLRSIPRIRLVRDEPSAVTSISIDGLDAHKAAILLGQQNILCRSGHFCCHHYLEHVRKLPPLLRISLGLHNTAGDIDRLCTALTSILRTL